eukprot:m.188678 g.188678  ORF g.188678 m.188678 type:complete len:575 (+) comp32352_c0_seq2:47-1771(+)
MFRRRRGAVAQAVFPLHARRHRQCCQGRVSPSRSARQILEKVVFSLQMLFLITSSIILLIIWYFWETISEASFICMVVALLCTPYVLRKVIGRPFRYAQLPKSPYVCIVFCYMFPNVMIPILTWMFNHILLLVLVADFIIARKTSVAIGQQLLTLVPISILRRIDQKLQTDHGDDDAQQGLLLTLRGAQLKLWAPTKYEPSTQKEITNVAAIASCLVFESSAILPVHVFLRLFAGGFAYAWTFHQTDLAMYTITRKVKIDVNLLWSQSEICIEVDLAELGDDDDDANVHLRNLVAEQLGVSAESIVLSFKLPNARRCPRCHECVRSFVCGCRGYFDIQDPGPDIIEYPFHRSPKVAGWVIEVDARVCVDVAITMLNGDSHIKPYTAPCDFSFLDLYNETLDKLDYNDEDVHCVESCDIRALDGVDLRLHGKVTMDVLLSNNPTAVTYQGGPYHVQLTLILKPTTYLTVEIKRADNSVEERWLPVCLGHSLGHARVQLQRDCECVGEMSLTVKQPDSTRKMLWDGRNYVGGGKPEFENARRYLSDHGVTEDSVLYFKPYRASMFSWTKRANVNPL